MRTFIALEFEEELKEYLAEQMKLLSSYCRKANMTKKENLHLTFRFLGEVRQTELSSVEEALCYTAGGLQPFTVTLGQLGAFKRENLRTLWLSLSPEAPLASIYKRLERNLLKEGFPKEKRPFSPHITLAREAELYQSEKLLFDQVKLCRQEVPVRALTLFESVREGRVLRYVPLARAELGRKL